jgi:hypothetical protein
MSCEGQFSNECLDASVLQRVKCIISFNRSREAALGTGLFSDPAWDLLLQVYSAELSRTLISQERLLLEIWTVPKSVAVRWLAVLVQRGHVELLRFKEPTLVRLTPRGRNAMDILFGQTSEGPCC